MSTAAAATALLALTVWQAQAGPAQARAATTPNPAAPAVMRSQISHDPSLNGGEPWVVADPAKSGLVLATWTTTADTSNPANVAAHGYCGLARSTDGGRTWVQASQAPQWGTQPGQPGDSTLAVAPDGTLYLECDLTASSGRMELVRSTDGGESWSSPVEVFGADRWPTASVADGTPMVAWDRPELVVDPSTGTLYLSASDDAVWGRAVTVSTDRGRTWSVPTLLDPDGQSDWGDTISAAHGVLAAGYVVDPSSVRYQTAAKPAVACSTPCVIFETSTNHGASWSRHVVPAVGAPGGNAVNGPAAPRVTVAADPSEAGRFAVLVPVAGSARLEVWLTRDSGRHWARTKVLPAPSGDTQAKWWMSYSPKGQLGVVWRTVDSSGNYNVSAIVSTDGGTTFGPTVALTDPAHPSEASGIGDDCACDVYLDGTNLMTGWGYASNGHREAWFGRFSYRK